MSNPSSPKILSHFWVILEVAIVFTKIEDLAHVQQAAYPNPRRIQRIVGSQ